MKPTDIGKLYDQITHLWHSDSFDKSNGIDQHHRALSFVQNRGKALDVGCGCSSRFIDLLLGAGFDVEGVDVSEQMVRLAAEKHPQITFYLQDICEWQIPHKYDFITAWDSIWHIPLDQQQMVMSKLLTSLNPNGVLLFSCGGTDQAAEHRDASMGPEIYYSSLGINGFLATFINMGCLCRHLEYDQYPELHSYFIVQKT